MLIESITIIAVSESSAKTKAHTGSNIKLKNTHHSVANPTPYCKAY